MAGICFVLETVLTSFNHVCNIDSVDGEWMDWDGVWIYICYFVPILKKKLFLLSFWNCPIIQHVHTKPFIMVYIVEQLVTDNRHKQTRENLKFEIHMKMTYIKLAYLAGLH